MNTRIDQTKLLTFAVSFMALLGLGLLLHLTQSFLVPFVIATLISLALIPVADFLVARKVPSALANALLIMTFLVFLFCVVLFVYGALVTVSAKLPFYLRKYNDTLGILLKLLATHFNIHLNGPTEVVELSSFLGLVTPGTLVQTINHGVSTLFLLVSRVTLMMLFLMFIIMSRDILENKIYAFFDAKKLESDQSFVLIRTIARQVQIYLLLKTVISIGTGAVFGGVAFLMGLDFAFMWGALAVVFNFIPTIGPVIASVPAILVAFLQFDNMLWAALVSFLLSAVQFCSGSFVEPMIMGNRLNLNLIAILLSLLLWGLIWGFPGMLLAVPIMAAVNIILSNIPTLKGYSILLSK